MFLFDFPLLSLLIWLPIAGGLVTLWLGANDKARARQIALVTSVLTLLCSVWMAGAFVLGTAEMQMVEKTAWIERFDIFSHLGIDGLSMPLSLLTTFTTVLVVLAGWEVIDRKPHRS